MIIQQQHHILLRWLITDTQFSGAREACDREGTVYYTFVDNNGNQTDKIRTMTGKLSQCEPVMYGDMAIWYTSDEDSVSFHGIFKDGSAYGTERGLLQEADGTWKYYVNDEVIMIIQDLPTMNMAGFTLKMAY